MRQSSPAAYFQGGVQQSSYSAPNFNMMGPVMPSMIPAAPLAAYGGYPAPMPLAGQPPHPMQDPHQFRPMPPELAGMLQASHSTPFAGGAPMRLHPGSAGRNAHTGIRSQPASNRTTPQGTPHSSHPGTPTKRTPSSQRLDPMRPMPPISPAHSLASTSGRSHGHEIDDNDNIKVVVRVRPMNEREQSTRDQSAVQFSEEDAHQMQVVVPGPKGSTMARKFSFHGILSPSSKQSDVLRMCGITQLLDAAMAGFHVTIFAYGQTGSGKTYTMSGREEMIENDDYSGDTDDGIMTRAVLYLFEQIQKRNNGCNYSLKASYCEIYNEALYDLLRFTKQQLPVKWDPSKGFHVPDLYVKECHSVAEMLQVISRGMRHRKMGSHELNLESSRSHSIMTVHCDATPSNPEDHDYGIPKFGKISFVDLAGSERVKDSKSTGDMLKETSSINRSLFTLGKVISALADNQAGVAGTAHIPYRDSKLTKLLMDSLGGSALALMIACCSPSMTHVDETMSTLSYATRAKNIRNKPIVQVNEQEATIAALRREVHLLRAENRYLWDACGGGTLVVGQQPSLPFSIQPDSSRTWSRGSSFNATDTAGNARPRRPSFSELAIGAPPPGQAPEGAGPGGMVKASSASNLQALGPSTSPEKDQPLSPEELAQRLAEAQRMVARFSRENERLAVQNDQLRNRRQLVDNDYKGALDEVDWLRLRLENLETTLLAGSPVKLLGERDGKSEASSGTHTPTGSDARNNSVSASVLNSSIGARLRDLSGTASQEGSPDVSPNTSPSRLAQQSQGSSPSASPTSSFTGGAAGPSSSGDIPAPMLPGSRLRANSREGSRVTGDQALGMAGKLQPPMMPMSPMMMAGPAGMPKPVPGLVAGPPMPVMPPGMRPSVGMGMAGPAAPQMRRPSGDMPAQVMPAGVLYPPAQRVSGDQAAFAAQGARPVAMQQLQAMRGLSADHTQVPMQPGMPTMMQYPSHQHTPQTPPQAGPGPIPGMQPSRPPSGSQAGAIPQPQRPGSGTQGTPPGSASGQYQRTPPPAGQIMVDSDKLNLLLGPS